MRTYKCEDNCGAELKISSDGIRGICPNCGREYYIISLEVKPLKMRLLKIAGERNRKNTSRANDLKALANEILNKEKDDVFATFYIALAEKMFGNIVPFQKFIQNANYNAMQDDFNMQILRDIVVESNARFKYDICNHIKRVLGDCPLATSYLARVDEVVEAESKSAVNYFASEKDVFVCHASEDVQSAENIVDELSKNGIKSWISTRNIRPNSPDYWQDIEQGIKNCRIMLVLSSGNSMNSHDCCKEIALAEKEGLLKLEYKLDKEGHNTIFEQYFEARQWIDSIDNYKKGISFVIATVKEMLEESKLNKQRHRLEEEKKEREKIAYARMIEEKTRQLEETARACLANSETGNFNNDGLVVVKSIINALVAKNLMMARQIFGQSIIKNDAINLIAHMAITLGEAEQTYELSKREVVWAKLKQQASNFKMSFSTMAEEEKALYISLNNSDILSYLYILFSTITEIERMQFIINYIKVVDVFDSGISKKLLKVLLKSGDDINASLLLKFNIGLGGDFVLKTVLECFNDGDAKLVAIDDIAKKYTYDDGVTDILNDYLLKSQDGIDVVLQVIKLMAKNNIRIDTQLLCGGTLSNKIDFEAIDIIFESLKGKALTSLDVDNLIAFCIQKDNSEIENAVLSFLINTCNIADIGADNVKKIWQSIGSFSGADRILIYSKLCAIQMERSTKEDMVRNYFDNQNDTPSDTVAIVNLFVQEKTKITLNSYENYLQAKTSDEATKIEVIEKLVEITMFYANVDNIVKKYYQLSTDSDATKVKIMSLLAKNQVTFDEGVSKSFLLMPQKSYSDGYYNIMKKYLNDNPFFASEMIKVYIANNATDDGNKIIETIVATIEKNFDIKALAYFIRYFDGEIKQKVEYTKKMLTSKARIKNLALSYQVSEIDFEVNIAQAFMIFDKTDEEMLTAEINCFVKEGCSLNDKIVCKNRKQKFVLKDLMCLIEGSVK